MEALKYTVLISFAMQTGIVAGKCNRHIDIEKQIFPINLATF